MSTLNESIVEDATLSWFGELGYAIGHGPHMAPGEPAAERESFGGVVLVEWLWGEESVGIIENLAQSAG